MTTLPVRIKDQAGVSTLRDDEYLPIDGPRGVKRIATPDVRTFFLGGLTGTLVNRGTIAAADLPASATAGDYYLLTESGTKHGKTWRTGDLAIYRSGAWDQVGAFFNRVANLKEFGCQGDGSTDDTANFEAAIASLATGQSNNNNVVQHGGIIHAPAGRYVVINVGLPSGIVLEGEGRDHTVFVAAEADEDVFRLETVPPPPNGVVQHRVVIRDCSIEGLANSTAGAAIRIDGGTDQTNPGVLIENVTIWRTYDGVVLKNVVGGTLTHVRVDAAVRYGFAQEGTGNALNFQTCSAYGCGSHGFFFRTNYSNFTACYSEANTGDGFHGFSSAGVGLGCTSFVNCGAEHNEGNGFSAINPVSSSWLGCYSQSSGGDGFHFEGAIGCVAHVLVWNADGYGFYTTGSYNNQLHARYLFGTVAQWNGYPNQPTGWSSPSGKPNFGNICAWGAMEMDVNASSIMTPGKFIARKTGGVAGTDEGALSYSTDKTVLKSFKGKLELDSADSTIEALKTLWLTGGIGFRSDDVMDIGSASAAPRIVWAHNHVVLKSATTTLLFPSSQIFILSGLQKIAGNGGNATLTSTPHIATPGTDGKIVTIQGTNDSAMVTLQDNGTLPGSGVRLSTATIQLGAGDSVTLMYDSTRALWEEISRSLLA